MRIVSLCPSLTELVFDLGRGAELVGITDYCVHPANRVVTGPLARFKRMLQSAQYRALIGHRAHRMRQVSLSDDKAHFAIKVTSSDGDVFGYSWHLGKVDAGSYKGMWMTTGVALVGKLGRSL